MTAVAGLSAMETARALSDGTLTARRVIEQTIARIDAVQPVVNAFPWVRREAALADAAVADARLAGGDARPLEGVPFTVKDLCAIGDGPSNQGSRAFAGHHAGVDAVVVQRLKAAGAILVATTASSEFGNRPTTESDLFGATRNPWNLDHTCGGSSGGAAVSAALGIASLNQGSDGGGSCRIPALCSGVFGLKPQRGRISLAPLMAEEWGGLDVYGALTRTVSDAALFLDITAGPAVGDPYWAPPPARSFLSAVGDDRPLRVAVAYERDGESVDEECKRTVEETARLLEKLGHTVVAAQPDLLGLQQPFLLISTIGIGGMPLTPEQLEQIEPRTRLIFDIAADIRANDYVQAVRQMHLETRKVATWFEDYDVLLTPTLSKAAPVIGEMARDIEKAWDDYRNWLCWTWPFNCTGQPAVSVPSGFTTDGLPLGVQLVGRHADERTLFMLAAQLEQERPWVGARPPTWV